MTFITLIQIISLIILVISFITIYHNTNSYEPSKRIIYIIVGTIIMYFITAGICTMDIKGIEIKSEEALNDTILVMKLIFTPINSMIVLSLLGNTFGKIKDNILSTEKAGKRIVIIFAVFILVLIFEANYIGSFIHSLLG